MNMKERYDYYQKIIDRAEREGLDFDRWTTSMDIKSADKFFNLNLNNWLESDTHNFLHDFIGISNHIDRSSFPAVEFKGFVPRFATVG